MIRNVTFLLFTLLSVQLTGCSEGVEPEVRQSAESAYDSAVVCLADKDFDQADELFTVARQGELPLDLMIEAGFQHAECLTELGRYTEALVAIDSVSDGAEGLDRVHLANARVHLAEGDKAKAKAEYDLAKAENPKVQKPEGL